MALDRQIARISKILVDSDGITFDEAQARLRALTLEVVVGPNATTPAAHAAALTAVSVGNRTFVGGVRLVGAVDQRLNSALPLAASTLGEAALEVGASAFEGSPSRRILIGAVPGVSERLAVSAWWRGWRAGVALPGDAPCGDGENALSGIAAGALSVGAAFETVRGRAVDLSLGVDLWPVDSSKEAPRFAEVFLPGALWLVGLGNLGQAFLWALAALPYTDPAAVSIVLQDRDKVTEENWATSVLVKGETYGDLKTKVAERWAVAKKFDVRRLDRHLLAADRLEDEDPRVAFCGVDKIEARKLMAKTGFDCIVDAGLGRKASDFDRYRVTVFNAARPIDKHFEGQSDESADDSIPDNDAYQRLGAEVGRCGTAEVAGASVAAPYVSAVAAAVAASRLINIASGCPCRINEVRRLSETEPKSGPSASINARGIRHAGRPAVS
ncbi:hypothetical protein GCM10010869_28990 [Mesorhizobium tianshanense]|uniref:ThiF family protein n=1 Tax=Mesorhizobium tianshanense TaxID=39844 RepID=A0A562NG98_9HYPH|nr:hypothetical protein [Mesorhizobium tianshanense]TWI31113.1 ThiF family protein [Mesorhizobium tianshanense]GLS37306.1 hypothetical protein GCM10010869_28990 [Mesorhizobium tianshanense]